MKRHRIALGLCLIGCVSVAICESADAQTAAQLPSGCSSSIAIQKANEFVDGRIAEYNKRSEAVLAEVQAIKGRARSPDVVNPDITDAELLSREDSDRLNELKRQFLSISAEKRIVSNYGRDIQVIAETYRAAKLADLHGISKEDLSDVDPRKFYFQILERLRASLPSTLRTPQSRQENNCDPEAGLYLEEEFNRQQLGKTGDVKHLPNLISDIERLRSLYDMSRNLLTKGIADVRAKTQSGKEPNSTSSIQSYVGASSAAIQSMYRTVVPYINQQFPSDESFEQAYRLKTKERIEQDYPMKK